MGCPEGYVLDEDLQLCVPGDPKAQAEVESGQAFKPTPKMERCIQNVKTQLRKTRKGMDATAIKSTAIAICRSRLKAGLIEEEAPHIPA